jgi:hypothetical protein
MQESISAERLERRTHYLTMDEAVEADQEGVRS